VQSSKASQLQKVPTILRPARVAPATTTTSQVQALPKISISTQLLADHLIIDAEKQLDSDSVIWSGKKAGIVRKVSELHAIAAGVLPPYIIEKLVDIGVLDDEDVFGVREDGDVLDQLDDVWNVMCELGTVVDRLSGLAVAEMADVKTSRR
jgi:hypothetical protein